MIYILSAPIQSGKTTSLINWSATRNDVYGILTPVINGKRIFMNAHTREQFPMEAGGEEEVLAIGRFIFSKAGFDKAIQIIRNAMNTEGWLVIDEIGPLELEGKGFYDIVNEILMLRKNKMILVVRSGLAEKVKALFMINATEVNSIDEI
ncbi:MAG TPA: nucleoside-triphosphatase [Chitinophagaceae bacterium]